MMSHIFPYKFSPIIQLLITVLIFCFFPEGLSKPIALLTWWLISFEKISKQELLLFIVCAMSFSLLNFPAIQKGVFVFQEQNLVGMPFYEYIMWGFYILFGYKHLPLNAYTKIEWHTWVVILFFIIFFFGFSENVLFKTIFTSLILFGALLIYRTKKDVYAVLFFMILGIVIEFSGVYFKQWSYPDLHMTVVGVPLWSISFWGGIGFLFIELLYLCSILCLKRVRELHTYLKNNFVSKSFDSIQYQLG